MRRIGRALHLVLLSFSLAFYPRAPSATVRASLSFVRVSAKTGRVHPSGTRARPRASVDSNDSSPVSRIPDPPLRARRTSRGSEEEDVFSKKRNVYSRRSIRARYGTTGRNKSIVARNGSRVEGESKKRGPRIDSLFNPTLFFLDHHRSLHQSASDLLPLLLLLPPEKNARPSQRERTERARSSLSSRLIDLSISSTRVTSECLS